MRLTHQLKSPCPVQAALDHLRGQLCALLLKDCVFKKFKSQVLKTSGLPRKPVPHSSTLEALFTMGWSALLLLTSSGDRPGDRELEHSGRGLVRKDQWR